VVALRNKLDRYKPDNGDFVLVAHGLSSLEADSMKEFIEVIDDALV
jgi:hypothetical protein